MIVLNNRARLDASLNDPKTTVFLLSGVKDSKAGEVHDFIEAKSATWDEWHRWFLITDTSVLSDAEKEAWFSRNSSSYYAVVGGTTLPKRIAQQGNVADLFNKDGKPGYLKIRKAFLEGDKI